MSTFVNSTDLNEYSGSIPSVARTSALHTEFGALYNRLRCKDKAVWDRLHVWAFDIRDPLAEAALAIGYARGFLTMDAEMCVRFAIQCVSWLRQQTDKNSYFCIGTFYELGIAMDVDITEAEKYYKMAAELGSEPAQLCIGYNFDGKDAEEEEKWYRLSAEAGYCVAQYNLGILYRDRGQEGDLREAAKWFQLAAAQGYSAAQCELGIRHYLGEGVEVDYIEAVQWLVVAAADGDREAQNMMGNCYDRGRGVVLDRVEMLWWYRLAVAQGEKGALYNLGLCYELGKGVTEDIDEAIRLYTLAKEQGVEEARNRITALQRPKK